MDEVDSILKSGSATLKEVEAFAVGVGPGSFTGTRIGVMTVKTFAAVLERPIYAVGGLDAIAMAYSGLRSTLVVPILPCRTNVVFACPFSAEQDIPTPLIEAAALPLSELGDLIAQISWPSVLFCGAAAERYREDLHPLLDGRVPQVSFGTHAFPAAGHIARMAHLRRMAGDPADDALELVPLYISPPPITLPKTPIPTQMPAT
jgi:tRNA threonylcarbamoyladenosine biosynthesis protein TsaB